MNGRRSVEMTQHTGLRPGKKIIRGNWKKLFLVYKTNLGYCLTSEQILVHQASWYTENRAITLIVHFRPQHGTIHEDFAKIRVQTLPWLSQERKTNLFTTCWRILEETAMGGLGCIGKPITNFIGLMTVLRREIIRGGTMANQVEAWKIVGILEEATLGENGMTFLAQIPTPLLFANGQFRQGKLQTYINGDCSKGDGMEVRVNFHQKR